MEKEFDCVWQNETKQSFVARAFVFSARVIVAVRLGTDGKPMKAPLDASSDGTAVGADESTRIATKHAQWRACFISELNTAFVRTADAWPLAQSYKAKRSANEAAWSDAQWLDAAVLRLPPLTTASVTLSAPGNIAIGRGKPATMNDIAEVSNTIAIVFFYVAFLSVSKFIFHYFIPFFFFFITAHVSYSHRRMFDFVSVRFRLAM